MKMFSQQPYRREGFSLLRTILERDDVPPRGKLLLGIFMVAAAGLVALGVARAHSEAFGWMLGATLLIALLVCLPENGLRRR